ncbi:ABC transporter permease [Desulfosoma caldarium]|uniref:Osmoprotectant transport system permease protein n=1 Tax=Desulfosoma caldarium TaxID=610254 RepID=A0A3N1UTV0_9BACT|nr:ABC transporter permease [Desulfosoma caldarium]ROQ92150.1 osmoprotectant transport system permease protein [Desulfosoma caldarium]
MNESVEVKEDRLGRLWMAMGLGFAFVAGAWCQQQGFFEFALTHPGDVLRLTKQHIEMVVTAGAIAIGLGVPVGILVTRGFMRRYKEITLNLLGICQTIPSLAIIAIAMGFLGIGVQTAIFGLVIYSIFPIIRNTAAGLADVDPVLLDAGRGMGMTPWQVMVRVEIPNAIYIILAGIRTSLVVMVGTAAVAFLIGGGGLGDLIFTGIALVDPGLMLAGAVPTALLAILTNWLLSKLEKVIVSKGLIKT